MAALPLISCLTVTTNRLTLLKEAIACFVVQTYPARELIIVAEGGRRYQDAIDDYLSLLGRDDIRLVRADSPGLTLGAKRNLSIDHASGEFLCQWDDDDLSHPERLRLQYEALRDAGAAACFLTDLLQFFADDRALFWLDWATIGSVEESMFPASMLVRRDERLRYPESGGWSALGEDNAYRAQVFRMLEPIGLGGRGYLYIYRYHGRNIWPKRHHQCFTATALGVDSLLMRSAELRRALAAFPLPRPYSVIGQGGLPVFLYDGPRAGDSEVEPRSAAGG